MLCRIELTEVRQDEIRDGQVPSYQKYRLRKIPVRPPDVRHFKVKGNHPLENLQRSAGTCDGNARRHSEGKTYHNGK